MVQLVIIYHTFMASGVKDPKPSSLAVVFKKEPYKAGHNPRNVLISETENCHTCLIQQIFLSEECLHFQTTLLSEKWHEESQQGLVVIAEDKVMLSNL